MLYNPQHEEKMGKELKARNEAEAIEECLSLAFSGS